jgi:adenylylsulfate kinase
MKKFRILVMGLPGSGKTTFTKELAKEINATIINADKVRKTNNDWDFSLEGRIKQSIRMKKLSEEILKEDKHSISEFICPTKKTRKNFNADYIIWMNTISKGRFDDTNQMFEQPSSDEINYEIKEKNAEFFSKIVAKEINKLSKNFK